MLCASILDLHTLINVRGNLQKVMDDLAQWTQKHACTSDFCYVVVGAFQFLGDIQGSVATCENDFKNAFGDFKIAESLQKTVPGSSKNSRICHFRIPDCRILYFFAE